MAVEDAVAAAEEIKAAVAAAAGILSGSGNSQNYNNNGNNHGHGHQPLRPVLLWCRYFQFEFTKCVTIT